MLPTWLQLRHGGRGREPGGHAGVAADTHHGMPHTFNSSWHPDTPCTSRENQKTHIKVCLGKAWTQKSTNTLSTPSDSSRTGLEMTKTEPHSFVNASGQTCLEPCTPTLEEPLDHSLRSRSWPTSPSTAWTSRSRHKRLSCTDRSKNQARQSQHSSPPSSQKPDSWPQNQLQHSCQCQCDFSDKIIFTLFLKWLQDTDLQPPTRPSCWTDKCLRMATARETAKDAMVSVDRTSRLEYLQSPRRGRYNQTLHLLVYCFVSESALE